VVRRSPVAGQAAARVDEDAALLVLLVTAEVDAAGARAPPTPTEISPDNWPPSSITTLP
jgi:hypothetical protein